MSDASSVVRRLWSDPLRRRWVVWGVLATGFLLVSVYRLSTAVLADQLTMAFDTTGAALGTLHAAFFYVYAPMQLVAGVLADRAGIRLTATAGVLVMNAGAIAFALASSYPVAFAARLAIGLGAGIIFIAILRFCANWFRPDEFATMNGITIAVAGFGGILAATPLALAVTAVGWRTTILSTGTLGIVVAVLIYLLTRDTPEQAGFDPIEDVPSAPTRSLSAVVTSAKTVLTERETWLAGVALFCSVGVNITVLGLWGVPYIVQTYDVSVTRASTYVLLGNVGLFVGPPTLGWLSDRIGRRTSLMVAGSAIFTLAFVPLALLDEPPLALVAVVFFLVGVLTGAYSLAYPVIKERHTGSASGVATGSVNAITYFGPALFPTAMGAVLDAYWTGNSVAGSRVYTALGYRVAFGLAALVGVVSFVCVVWLHVRTHRHSVSGSTRTRA